MKLFNTLSRKIEEFKPIKDNEVSLYTCGPTVYDYAHIGHWFTYVRWDILVRTLRLTGYKVNWVMNITDVGHLTSDADEGEDKLEKGAKREGKTAWEVADFFTKDFLKEMELLNILTPSHIVKATEHISEQIELIKILEQREFTYIIDDGVYFDTSRFPSYADFAQLDIDEQIAGSRVNFNRQKRNISDFALWKFSPKNTKRDMEWDSPWGKGFPGWHIECSAMCMKYLGETIDIHTGGIDHIPIHHTNEIAQSEAATGKKFANFWLHSNHVLIDDNKISKSLGNGIRLQDVIGKGFDAQELRCLILESHYQSQSQFNFGLLEASRNRYADLRALAVLRFQLIDGSEPGHNFSEYKDDILSIMAENLSSPKALAFLSQVSKKIQASLVSADSESEFTNFIGFLDQLFGFKLSSLSDISEPMKDLISRRNKARADKDWALADKIRQELELNGLGVRDVSDNKSIWFYL